MADRKGASSEAPVLVIPKDASVAQIEQMEQSAYDAIESVQDVDEAEALLDRVTVAAHAVRLAEISGEHEQRWVGLRLRAERRYGELLPPKLKGGRPSKETVTSGYRSKDQLMTESRARKVADIPTDVFEAYLADTPKPTRNGLLRAGGSTPRPRKKKTALIENPVEKFRNRVREIRAHGGDRPRWSMADLDLADAVLRNPPKRKKAEAGKHLHDLYARRRKAGDELDGGLWQARIDIIKMVGHLESVDFVTNGLRDADQDTVADIYEYLGYLASWLDRSLEVVSGHMDEQHKRSTIRKLREGTKGRTPEEIATARRLADNMERKLVRRLAAAK